jgi:DME family drug/metabolite transporter
MPPHRRTDLTLSSVPVLALSAALCFSMAGIILRRALALLNPLTAACVSVTVTAVITWLFASATADLSLIFTPAVLPFLLAGLIAPGLSRLILFVGYSRIGIGRTVALMSTTPLFAILIAILFLGERPSLLLLAGATLIVGGGVLMAQRARDDTSWRRRHMIFPFIAALGFAVRDTISRAALVEFPHSVIAAAAATLAAVVAIWTFAGVQRGMGRVAFNVPGVRLALLSGLCEGTAYILMWRALGLGSVSDVVPLVNATPLFTVVLIMLFLRGIERMTWRVSVASAMAVAGVFLVVLGRG